MGQIFTIVVVLVVLILLNVIRVLREYERGVIFRLGRLYKAKGPGLILVWPGIDKMVKAVGREVADLIEHELGHYYMRIAGGVGECLYHTEPRGVE